MCSATNPTTLPKKLTTLSTIAGNASTAFPASHLSASASLFNHLFKTPSSHGGELPTPTPTPKVPVIAIIIVEMVTERAVNTGNVVMPCSRNKIPILSAKDVFLSKTFSRVCLILATSV